MKYMRALILGFVVGIALFLTAFYFNPFSLQSPLSPLSVSNSRLAEYSYSRIPEETLVFTNNGETRTPTHPDRIQELWEPAVKDTSAFVTILRDTAGKPAGIGVKISSWSEDSELLRARPILNSDWHLFVPQFGTAYIEQTENLWSFLRAVAIPATITRSWQGNWHGVVTNGPNALQTARLYGGSGAIQDLQSEAAEIIHVESYSANDGPTQSDGRLTLDIGNGR